MYKCYNPRSKKLRVSRGVIFVESTSWYSLSSTTLEDFESIVGNEASEADALVEEDIDTLDESRISFRLSGLNEELSQNGQPFDMLANDEELVVQPMRMNLKRWPTRKNKGKKKMTEYSTEDGMSDRCESDGAMSEDKPPELRSELAKTALKTANERLHGSSC